MICCTPLDFHKSCAVIIISAYLHLIAQSTWYCFFDVVDVDIKEEGEITQPCGIPAEHGLIVDTVVGSFTCWVGELKKLWIQSHTFLLMFLVLSFNSKIE